MSSTSQQQQQQPPPQPETEPDATASNRKPYKIKDVTRNIKKAVVAASLDEVKRKSAEKFDRGTAAAAAAAADDILPTIHLDSDGTEIDDEDYFQTLEPNAELIAVFAGEQWMDPTHYVTITTRRHSAAANDDQTDAAGGAAVCAGAEVERVHLKKIVGQLKNNLCNVSVLSDPDLEMLSNMDPNSLADITGKEFMEQLKEVSGRILHEKREASDAIELLKLFARHHDIAIDMHQPKRTCSGQHVPVLLATTDPSAASSSSLSARAALEDRPPGPRSKEQHQQKRPA